MVNQLVYKLNQKQKTFYGSGISSAKEFLLVLAKCCDQFTDI